MAAKPKEQAKHEFALIIDGIPDLTPEILDRLYEAGCADALISRSDGVVSMDFARIAPSPHDAITSAMRDVESAGVGARVVHVEENVTSSTKPSAKLVSEVGSLNSVLHSMSIIEMDANLRPLMLNRLGVAGA